MDSRLQLRARTTEMDFAPKICLLHVTLTYMSQTINHRLLFWWFLFLHKSAFKKFDPFIWISVAENPTLEQVQLVEINEDFEISWQLQNIICKPVGGGPSQRWTDSTKFLITSPVLIPVGMQLFSTPVMSSNNNIRNQGPLLTGLLDWLFWRHI